MLTSLPTRFVVLLSLGCMACGGESGDPDAAVPNPDADADPDAAAGDGGSGNRAPTASAATVETQMEVAYTGRLVGTDPDGDTIGFSITANPTHGTVTLDDAATGAFTYTPNADYAGEDQLTFEVTDGSLSASATVTVVVHYLSDGTLDTTFSGDGVVTDAAPNGSFSDLLILADGRIIVAGNAASADLLLAAYETNGELDESFGTDGVVITDIAGGYDAFNSLGMQSSGRVIAAGQSVGATRDFLVAAYSDEGVLDTTFGVAGYARVDFAAGGDASNALLVLSDDSLLVGGYAMTSDGDEDFAVVKLDASGAVDESFGTDGWAVVDFAGGDDRISEMALDASGRVVLAGGAPNAGGTVTQVALARLDGNGALDTTFGTGGRTIVTAPDDSQALSVLIDGGRIWAAGGSYDAIDGTMLLVALDADGGLDETFGDSGWVAIDFPADGAGASAMVQLPGGGFVLAGTEGRGGTGVQAAMAALTADGALDPRFGDGGRLIASYGDGGSDRFAAIRRASDGRLVAVGWSREGTNVRPLIARFAR